MGWQMAVTVSQYLMRRLHTRVPSLGQDIPPTREVRRDVPGPSLCSAVDWRQWWAYIDNTDEDEINKAEEAAALVNTLVNTLSQAACAM